MKKICYAFNETIVQKGSSEVSIAAVSKIMIGVLMFFQGEFSSVHAEYVRIGKQLESVLTYQRIKEWIPSI